MKGLKELLLNEQARLEEIKKNMVASLKDVPDGTLRITRSNNHTQYYHYTHDSKQCNGRYIPKTEENLVRKLAQKSYNKKVLKLVEKRLHQLKELTEEYQDDEIEEIFLKQHVERRKLVSPIELTWEQRLNQWINEEYIGKGFKEDDLQIYSEKGERVRSKSEKIIADYLYRNNIPYKYEKPFKLDGYGIVYPDFTFLSKKTYKEIYWEHEGRMDDPTYARTAIKKIKTYEENGIYVGERLILTFETQNIVLNTSDIIRNVERFVLQ